jgi:hypothetical protein
LNGSDLLSQLAALLQGGTPMTAIVDRIANMLSSALARATGNDGDATRRRTLERALASALAPPGTSPPNQSGRERAASLEQRLATLLRTVTRELKTTASAGQQSRFSGEVLDANSAREIPAQQQTKDPAGTQLPDGTLAFADSILRSVLQQVQAQAQSGATQSAQSASAQSAQPAQITVQSADVLGRMLARAAKADGSGQAQPAPGTSGVASASDLFARLMSVIAKSSNEGGAQQGGTRSQDFAFTKDGLPSTHQAHTTEGSATPAFASLTAPTASAPAVQFTPAPAPATVDPQAVIEQVVKGIVLRNFGSTSEVRMRLQPEHLGDVSLKLTVTGTTISANVVAQNADVRDMLLANQQQLARSLAQAGLSLGAFSVDVSGGNPGFAQQQTPQHRSLSRAGALHLDAAAEEDTWADSRFGPPVLAGAKPLVLNYLA